MDETKRINQDETIRRLDRDTLRKLRKIPKDLEGDELRRRVDAIIDESLNPKPHVTGGRCVDDIKLRDILWVSTIIIGILVTGVVVLAINDKENGTAGACLAGAITALTAVTPAITYWHLQRRRQRRQDDEEEEEDEIEKSG